VYFIVAKIVFSQQLFTFANLKVGHSQQQKNSIFTTIIYFCKPKGVDTNNGRKNKK
jgi:hypothetical protein